MKSTRLTLFAGVLGALLVGYLFLALPLDMVVGGKYGDNGDALEATSGAWGMLVKPGQLLIADTSNHEIRSIDTVTGVITRVVGSGRYPAAGSVPTDGPALAVEINSPIDLVEFEGLLYFCETNGGRIRVLDPATGIVSVIATGLLNPTGITIDPAAHTLLVGEAGRQRVLRFGPLPCTRECPFSVMTFTGATLSLPYDLLMEPDGSLLILDFMGKLYRSTNGVLTKIAGGGSSLVDGIPAATARLSNPSTMARDPQGNIYIADAGSSRVRKIGLDGIITTVVGNGQNASGNPPDGITDPLALPLGEPRGVAIDPLTGALYVSAPLSKRIYRVTLGGPPASTATPVSTSTSTAVPTATAVATSTATRVATATATAVATSTATAVATSTSTATTRPTNTATLAPTCVPECRQS